MTRPRARRTVLVAAAIALVAVSCTDEEPDASPSTSTGSTIAPDDPALEQLLLTTDDLPDGFTATEDVADTVTTFCAGEDAAAGLQASGRAIVGFTRAPPGASVIEVVFRFEDDGAATFVEQAEELLTSCSDVPDLSGLAFTYEPPDPSVADALAATEGFVSRYGTSVGSEALTTNVAAFRTGDRAALVAVLGVDQPRAELDVLAAKAFGAAADRLSRG